MGSDGGCLGTRLANAGSSNLAGGDLHQPLQRDADVNAPAVVNLTRAFRQRTAVGLPTDRTKRLVDRFHLFEESIHDFMDGENGDANCLSAGIEPIVIRADARGLGGRDGRRLRMPRHTSG